MYFLMSCSSAARCSVILANCGKPPYMAVAFVQFQSPSEHAPPGPMPWYMGKRPAV